jgi:HEAT repeat protein
MRRGSWLPFLLVCAAACRGKAPYEGKSVAELERMLRDPDPAVQTQGAFGLSRVGAEALPAVPALTEALKSPQSIVRQNAALALGQIGPEAKDAVPALTAVLRDREWAVRRQVVVALGQIGPDARSAAAVEKLRQDPDSLVRKAAAEALKKIRR